MFLEWESCIPFFQAETVFRTMTSNCKPCLAIAYDIAVIFLKQPIEAQLLLSQLKKLPNSNKSRLNFLSPDVDTEYSIMVNGQNTYGKSMVKQSVSIPLSRVAAELLSLVHGNYNQCVVHGFVHTSPRILFFLRPLSLPWNSFGY